MDNRKNLGARLLNAVRRGLYQRFLMDRSQSRTILFVFGCQRSGTSMFTSAFRNDLSAKVYGERGLAAEDSIRVRPLEDVKLILDGSPATFQISKPLVESQRAREFLEYFPEAKAVWMFRKYADVARSAQKRFSAEAPMRNLRPILTGQNPGFASENVSAETRLIVRRHFDDHMSADAAQALFWYVRNICYFEQDLHTHSRVMLRSYEDFVANPIEQIESVYSFLGRRFPGPEIVAHVRPRLGGKQASLNLPADLAENCNNLYARLRSTVAETTQN